MSDQTLKDMVITALREAGGVVYLKQQAEANPVAFMALLGSVLRPAPNYIDLRDADLSDCSIYGQG